MALERTRWSRLGRKQPYWASFSEPQYRSQRIDDAAIEAFFASGEREVAATLAAIREIVGSDFHPARALDFGCGVGRLTIPLARECRLVVAVDISDSMLEEARENCLEQNLSNVEFMDAREFAKDSNRRRFDFVHSVNVFQHIGPRPGVRITRRILEMLSPGGFAALHYTYSRKAGPVRKTLHRARRWVPPLNVAANIVQRRGLFEPPMPMYTYDMARLFDLFRAQRCAILSVQLGEHRGYQGATFYLRKSGPENLLPPASGSRPLSTG